MREGPRRLLVALYTLLAVAACSRAVVQLGGSPSSLPYWLSALAGAVYLVIAVQLRRTVGARLLVMLCSVELLGVLVIGTWSIVRPFPRSTVWSDFGSGYGGLPLVLPVVALLLLYRSSAESPSLPRTRRR